MNTTEIRNLSDEELITKIKGLQEELYKLNCQRKTGQVDKPHRFQLVRKDIARIKTIMNMRKHEERRKA